MSETPFVSVPEYQRQLTDREIENRPELFAENRIDLYEDAIVRPEAFEVSEINHDAIQPPTYEAPSHLQLLRQSIEASPNLVLVKDIADVGVALGAVRRSKIAA